MQIIETNAFKEGIRQLEEMALQQRTAYMCSEAVWWRCHRSMISDYLKLHGWKAHHIMEIEKASEHTYTKPATIVDGKLFYGERTLL